MPGWCRCVAVGTAPRQHWDPSGNLLPAPAPGCGDTGCLLRATNPKSCCVVAAGVGEMLGSGRGAMASFGMRWVGVPVV